MKVRAPFWFEEGAGRVLVLLGWRIPRAAGMPYRWLAMRFLDGSWLWRPGV